MIDTHLITESVDRSTNAWNPELEYMMNKNKCPPNMPVLLDQVYQNFDLST